MTTKAKIEDKVETMSEDMDQLKQSVVSLVQEFIARNRDWLLTAKDDIAKTSGKALGATEKVIKQRPLYAVLIAFILGILFKKMKG
jgi:ElaB/YqjD/DUF883 family membrane-anchored ribosome-binding protein